MYRGIGFRTGLIAVIAVSGAVGSLYGYVANENRVDRELASSYETHLKTVKDLVEHARAHAIEPQFGFSDAVENLSVPKNMANRASLNRFEKEQGLIATAARELIATMDGELDPRDNTFASLIRRFDSEERALSNIRGRRHRRSRLASLTLSP